MKILYLILPFFSYITGFSQKSQRNEKELFYLSGYVEGRDTGLLILTYYDSQAKWIQDTTYLKKGKFEFKGQINQPTYAGLQGYHKEIDFNEANYVGVFIEAGRQTIYLIENDYENAKMQGSKTQTEYAFLMRQIDTTKLKWKDLDDESLKAKKNFLSEKDTILKKQKGEKSDQLFNKLLPEKKEIQNVVILFIVQHPDSYVSASMLFNPINFLSLDSAKLLYNGLSTRIKNSRDGKLAAKAINKKEQNTTGAKAPALVAKTINGQSLSLSDFQGKYVLLDFWASWCVPCREAIPHLKELYNAYHSKGFEIVTISIDRKKNEWEKAVGEEEINNWHNVLVNEEINKNYENVHLPIPSSILINKSGIIIWKSNDKNNKNSLENVLSGVINKK